MGISLKYLLINLRLAFSVFVLFEERLLYYHV